VILTLKIFIVLFFRKIGVPMFVEMGIHVCFGTAEQ